VKVGSASEVEAVVRRVVTNVLQDVELHGIAGLSRSAGKALIPVGVSARHVHVCQDDLEHLFGRGYTLTHERDLLQPGEFASKESVTLVGPQGKIIPRVRILGPYRSYPCHRSTKQGTAGKDGLRRDTFGRYEHKIAKNETA
jgi:propanediol utilization protein